MFIYHTKTNQWMQKQNLEKTITVPHIIAKAQGYILHTFENKLIEYIKYTY